MIASKDILQEKRAYWDKISFTWQARVTPSFIGAALWFDFLLDLSCVSVLFVHTPSEGVQVQYTDCYLMTCWALGKSLENIETSVWVASLVLQEPVKRKEYVPRAARVHLERGDAFL